MVTIILPPAAAIEAASAELDRAAVEAGNVRRQIAVSKGAYDLLVNQPTIVRLSGAYLVPSTSQAGVIHRVPDLGNCTCPAGQSGKECRHKVAIELIEQANTRVMPALPRRVVDLETAKREMDELFA
jgi:hypothetical protein